MVLQHRDEQILVAEKILGGYIQPGQKVSKVSIGAKTVTANSGSFRASDMLDGLRATEVVVGERKTSGSQNVLQSLLGE